MRRKRRIIRCFSQFHFVALNSTAKNVDSKGSFQFTKERNFTWATRRNDFLNTSTSRHVAFYSHCIVGISPYSTSRSGILFAWTTFDLDILRKFQCVSKPTTRPNSWYLGHLLSVSRPVSWLLHDRNLWRRFERNEFKNNVIFLKIIIYLKDFYSSRC